MTALGRRVRKLRTERGFTQRVLALRVGVGHPYISRIESGRERPSAALLSRLAAHLDADPQDLQRLANICPACQGTGRARK